MKIITKSKFLEFKCAKSPDNKDWYYVKRTNDTKDKDSAVVITTLVYNDNEYNFLFLKTKRPPIYAENKAKYCLESPAGLIGDIEHKETLIECAKKELLEETGLVADRLFVELENCSTSSGLSSETLSYITAIVNNYDVIKQPVSDGGIIVDRFMTPVKSIRDYLTSLDKKEYSIATATISGIFFALNRI